MHFVVVVSSSEDKMVRTHTHTHISPTTTLKRTVKEMKSKTQEYAHCQHTEYYVWESRNDANNLPLTVKIEW